MLTGQLTDVLGYDRDLLRLRSFLFSSFANQNTNKHPGIPGCRPETSGDTWLANLPINYGIIL